jgi:transcriptional regulator with XRE-family HTH domain
MNIGQAIRNSRQSRNLSQQDVGNFAQVSRQAIGLLEANGGRMSTLAAVAPHAPFKLYGLAAAACPAGVDPTAWAKADAREPVRLTRQARG